MYNYHGCGYGYGHGYGRRGFAGRFRGVPVNIQEKEDHFELSLYAPGLNKDNIKVSVKDDTLTISYDLSSKEEDRFTRREYNADSFERSFVLNNRVNTIDITAVYQEGILKVLLPKNPETNQPPKNIKVD